MGTMQKISERLPGEINVNHDMEEISSSSPDISKSNRINKEGVHWIENDGKDNDNKDKDEDKDKLDINEKDDNNKQAATKAVISGASLQFASASSSGASAEVARITRAAASAASGESRAAASGDLEQLQAAASGESRAKKGRSSGQVGNNIQPLNSGITAGMTSGGLSDLTTKTTKSSDLAQQIGSSGLTPPPMDGGGSGGRGGASFHTLVSIRDKRSSGLEQMYSLDKDPRSRTVSLSPDNSGGDKNTSNAIQIQILNTRNNQRVSEEVSKRRNVSQLGLVYFLFDKYFKLILNRWYIGPFEFGPSCSRGYMLPIMPLIFVILLTTWGGINVWQSLKLKHPTEEEKWFRDPHMFNGVFDAYETLFQAPAQTQQISVNIQWGTSGLQRDDFWFYEPDLNRGVPIWNPSFKITPENLDYIADICEKIQEVPCSNPECAKSGTLVRPNSVICFPNLFNIWLKEKKAILPLAESHEEATQSVSLSSLGISQAGLAENGYKAIGNEATNPDQAMVDLLKEFRSDVTEIPKNTAGKSVGTVSTYATIIGFVGGDLKYVSISFYMNVQPGRPFDTNDYFFSKFDNMVDNIVNRVINPNLGKATQEGSVLYAWHETQIAISNTLFNGIALALPLCFLALLLGIKNIILAFVSVLCVCFVVVGVLGLAKYARDWSLGPLFLVVI